MGTNRYFRVSDQNTDVVIGFNDYD